MAPEIGEKIQFGEITTIADALMVANRLAYRKAVELAETHPEIANALAMKKYDLAQCLAGQSYR